MSVTALQIITPAFETLNVFMPGDTIDPAQSESARGFLNRLIGEWRLHSLTIPAVSREIFHTIAGKGGPSNPYTIGAGGALDTIRPSSSASIVHAGLLLNSSSPVVEIPRFVLTDDMYESIRIKELPSTLFTHLYYNPTYTVNNLGTLNLWPVPTTADNDLVLYLQRPLVAFANLSATSYELPDGVEQALVENLVLKIAKPWGATIDDDMRLAAANALRLVKRNNLKMSDLANDFASDRSARYNIQTG